MMETPADRRAWSNQSTPRPVPKHRAALGPTRPRATPRPVRLGAIVQVLGRAGSGRALPKRQ